MAQKNKSEKHPFLSAGFKPISYFILMEIAVKNLWSKKLRTFLTLFGVVIGIGAIYFLLSFGFGLRNLVSKEIIGSQSVKSIDITSANSRIVKLDQPTVEKIQALPHISKLGASYSFAGSISYNKSELDSVVYGVDDQYSNLENLVVSHGRLITNADTSAALINRAGLQSLNISEDDEETILGKKITVLVPKQRVEMKEDVMQEVTIVGVVDSGNGTEIFLPAHVFQTAQIQNYTQVKILADDTKNISQLRQQIESLGFVTSSPNDTIGQINQIFKFFNVVLVGFGAIGMIVAILGMFNTLTISLIERTKEIGLMMALGGRRKDMRRLFTFEAIVLSIGGAAIGVAFARINSFFMNEVMNAFARNRGVTEHFTLFSNPWWLQLGMIIFMVIVGMLVVYFPARRAERISPIEALRRE